jgi:hypothetical protein
VDLPSASSETAFDLEANNLPTNDAVLAIRLGTMGDPALRRWLLGWQDGHGARTSLRRQSSGPEAAGDLREALDRSPLPSTTLLNIAAACFAISPDRETAGAILSRAVPASDAALQSWFAAWRQDLAGGVQSADADLESLQRALEHGNCDCATLARLGRAVAELSNNASEARVSSVICAAAMASGHRVLGDQTRLTAAARDTLLAMKEVEPIIWDTDEFWPDHRYLRHISDMTADIQRLVPLQDGQLGWLGAD